MKNLSFQEWKSRYTIYNAYNWKIKKLYFFLNLELKLDKIHTYSSESVEKCLYECTFGKSIV